MIHISQYEAGLFLIAIVVIIGIVLLDWAIGYNFKSYHECQEPIYQNRIKHFDKYLKQALESRTKHETIEDVALRAAQLKWDNTQIAVDEKTVKAWFIDTRKNEYLHELESANIE